MKHFFSFTLKNAFPFCQLSVLLLLLLCHKPAVAQGFNQVPDEVEYQALVDLYNSTNGAGWTNNANWLKGTSHTDFAAWYGVVVENGDVSRLHLAENNLSGSLPASLDKLAQLIYLELPDNQISGPIPVCLANMPGLIGIMMPGNQLTGTIPEALGQLSRLQVLDLSNNQLTGSIPASLGDLSEMNYLYLYRNKLSGPIPERLGSLTNLIGLSLGDNQLTGPIPERFANLSHLSYLVLGSNKLTGTIPTYLDSFSNLFMLDLSNNQLTGSIPENIGSLTRLSMLLLYSNQLEGLIPESLGNLSQLEYLVLSSNRLSGTIPAKLGNLSNLSDLALDHNKLTGTIPESLVGLKKLGYLILNHNQLTGSIPASLADLPELSQLSLEHNQLSGTIPAAFNSLPKLTYLILNDNKFTLSPDFRSVLAQGYVVVSDNYLGFSSIEINFDGPNQYPADRFYFYNQAGLLPVNNKETGADTIQFDEGRTVEMWVQDDAPHNVYQWRKINNLGRWVDIPGATARRYTISNTLASAAGTYQCLVSNSWVTGMRLASQRVVVEASSLLPPGKLAPNLPRETSPAGVVGNKAPPATSGTGGTMNYVRTYTPRAAISAEDRLQQAPVDSVQVSTAYFDGLGRPVQTVTRQESPLKRDIIQPVAYDAYGRQVKDYLPYTAEPTAAGDYRPDALPEQYRFYTQSSAYNATLPKTDYPFAEKAFEASPLNRVLQQAAPGESWQLNSGHALAYGERTNAVADSVWLWAVDAGTGASLTVAGRYDAGQLWVNQVTDEHGARSLEFKDKEGRAVLKQVEQGKAGFTNTYYVYDDLGNLRYVLPPQAVALLRSNKGAVTGSVLDYAFRYHYDHRQRLIIKKVPGAGDVHYVYDKLDREVLSQDANQRLNSQWSFTKYDVLGRPILTGLYTNTTSGADRLYFQTQVDEQSILYESPSAEPTNHYYSDRTFPVLEAANSQLLTVSYYDGYDFDQEGKQDVAFDSVSHAFPERPFYRVRGQLTASKSRVLGTDTWLWSVSFYDDRYRVLQTQTENYPGGKDVLTSRYDFSGKVLETKLVHQKPGKPEVPVVQAFVYDHAGRLLETRQSTGQQAEELIAKQSYNELGQLQTKQLGNNLQQLDYNYNIRGWLTGINDAALTNTRDLFGLELSYDRGFDKAYFNGNISGIRWKSYRDNVQRAYGYHYDTLNRILQADYRALDALTNTWTGEQEADQGNFDVTGISYDLNGNILSMERRGLLGFNPGQRKNTYGQLDLLNYAYQGNQLKAVDDEQVTPENQGDFEDNGSKYNGAMAEYAYDANGNLTSDQNKGITGITYNHLNLPTLISFGEKGSMELVYTASGVKLRKIVREAGKGDKMTDYAGAFIYQNDTLQFAHTAEGRVLFRPPNSLLDWVYEYHYKDQLGNTRLAFRKQEHEVKVATLEPSRLLDEQQDFDNIVETRSPDRSYNGNYSSRLNAALNKPLGPFTMLPVQRGDSLSMSAFASYQPESKVGKSWALAAFISSLFNSTVPPPPGTEGYRNGKYTPYIGLALGASIAALQPEPGVPNAYLKYIVLDQDSQYVYSDVQVISSAAGQNWQELKLAYKVAQEGFVQVFVYNESDQEVFFDDITIRKDPALIVQENHYDPWGLNLVGIEMQGRPDHKFQYNGKEKQEEFGLHWNDYGARFYDPQLGRWHAVDPMATARVWLSPYNYVQNNPLNRIDPTGAIDWFRDEDGNVSYDPNLQSQADLRGTKGTYLGDHGYGINEHNGNIIHYQADGNINESVAALGEVSFNYQMRDDNPYAPYATNDFGELMDAYAPLLSVTGGDVISDFHSFGRDALNGDLVGAGVSLGAMAIPAVNSSMLKIALGGSTAMRKVGSALESVDDVMANPSLLQGKPVGYVRGVLKNSDGWKEGALTKGRSTGQGWTLRELNSRGTDFTDLYIQYSPGSPRHFGGNAYWKVSSGNSGTQWFPAQ